MKKQFLSLMLLVSGMVIAGNIQAHVTEAPQWCSSGDCDNCTGGNRR